MRRIGIRALGLTAILLFAHGAVSAQGQEAARKRITESEIKRYINRSLGENSCESLDRIDIHSVEYHDFIGDGKEEAVVVASTCMTGTAGPDIHAVYKREADGKVAQLPFVNANGDPRLSEGEKKIPVFGNANFALTVEDGKLVARWGDSSDREEPAVVWYKWDGKRFVVDHVKIKGPFATSYDCAKATREIDLAICYSPSIAALDLELGQAYRAALQKLPADKRQELQSEQRAWLKSREGCPIYKWWVGCLQDLYDERIEMLKRR
jgi:uncharacterized protein YecT (DUF1311 family)